MNADMLNRGTEDPPPPLSLSFSFFLGGGGGERTLRSPLDPPRAIPFHMPYTNITIEGETTRMKNLTINRKQQQIYFILVDWL
jgi:hypothetical protein